VALPICGAGDECANRDFAVPGTWYLCTSEVLQAPSTHARTHAYMWLCGYASECLCARVLSARTNVRT